eukprot:gene26620-47473_t
MTDAPAVLDVAPPLYRPAERQTWAARHFRGDERERRWTALHDGGRARSALPAAEWRADWVRRQLAPWRDRGITLKHRNVTSFWQQAACMYAIRNGTWRAYAGEG